MVTEEWVTLIANVIIVINFLTFPLGQRPLTKEQTIYDICHKNLRTPLPSILALKRQEIL